MLQLNSEVLHRFKVTHVTLGTGVTGLTAASFTISLRRKSGSTIVAASETVTVEQVGGGEYWIRYTPTAAATNYTLSIVPVSAANVANPFEWDDLIEPVSSLSVGPYLTTLANMKTRFDLADDEHDARINLLLAQVTDYFERACDRVFFAADLTEYPEPLSPALVRRISVQRPPVNSIASLWFSAAIPRVYDATTLLVQGTDYFLDEDLEWLTFVTPKCLYGVANKAFKITYNGGYATVPPSISAAAEEVLVTKVQKSQKGGQYHLAGAALADSAMSGIRFDDMTPNALAAIELHRLRSVA